MATALPCWLKLLDKWRVLVCMPHARGVTPGCVKVHLRVCHGKLDLPTSQNSVEHVKHLQLSHPADVGKPPDGGQALPELELHHGYQCKWPGCREQYHICTNRATQLAHQR